MIEWIFVGIFIGLGTAIMAGYYCFGVAIEAMMEIANDRWEEEHERKERFSDYFHGKLRP